ncbi:hypothetical protein D3C86_1766230 [compost metagenome]
MNDKRILLANAAQQMQELILIYGYGRNFIIVLNAETALANHGLPLKCHPRNIAWKVLIRGLQLNAAAAAFLRALRFIH